MGGEEMGRPHPCCGGQHMGYCSIMVGMQLGMQYTSSMAVQAGRYYHAAVGFDTTTAAAAAGPLCGRVHFFHHKVE